MCLRQSLTLTLVQLIYGDLTFNITFKMKTIIAIQKYLFKIKEGERFYSTCHIVRVAMDELLFTLSPKNAGNIPLKTLCHNMVNIRVLDECVRGDNGYFQNFIGPRSEPAPAHH